MELDPTKLNDYPIKVLQNYCKAQNLAVRGTRKDDYVLIILAHLQKTKGVPPVSTTGGSAKDGAKGGGIDSEAAKRLEAEERRREEERIKYEQWRAEEEERKRKAQDDERRERQEQERKLAEEQEAKREQKRKCERIRELEARRAQERTIGSVGTASWTLERFVSDSDTPPASPSSAASSSSGAASAAEKREGEMRTLHVDKTQQPGHNVRLLAALEMQKRGQRSILAIDKPSLSFVEQQKQAEVWVGMREGKIAVYCIDMKKLKDKRKEKWKKTQTFRIREEREKQSVRQLIQIGRRVWAMAEGDEPAVFDIKTYSQVPLPEHKKGREILRYLSYAADQSLVWAGFTAGIIRAYDSESMSLVIEYCIRPAKASAKKGKDDEDERERINCLIPCGNSLLVGTTKGVREYIVVKKENQVELVPSSFLPTSQSVTGLTLSNHVEETSEPPLRRVWASTKDSVWVILCTEQGRIVAVSAKMSGALAFPADGLLELGCVILTYGSSLRMVVWGAQDVTYLSSGPDMDAYHGPSDKNKRKTKWTDSLKSLCRGPEYSVGEPTLWTVDDQFLALWRVE